MLLSLGPSYYIPQQKLAAQSTCHVLISASPHGGHWAPRTWVAFGPAFEAPQHDENTAGS